MTRVLLCGRDALAGVGAVPICWRRGSLDTGVGAAGGAGVEAGFWKGGSGGLAIPGGGRAPAGAACGRLLRRGVALPPVASWCWFRLNLLGKWYGSERFGGGAGWRAPDAGVGCAELVSGAWRALLGLVLSTAL